VIARLAAAIDGGARAAIAVEEVAPEATGRYGIVVPGGDGDPFPVAGIVEKPAPSVAPSRLAVAGRYAATAALLDALRATAPDAGGEVQLADALSALDGVVAVRLREPDEERFDVGTVAGYCAAFVEYALSDPELGPTLRERVRPLLDGQR
jgi:UTP--glucose-1-phosphate uridylyltransferase